MSRTSRVPYHQSVYDLLLIEPRPLPHAAKQIRTWERCTGHRFPAAMPPRDGDVTTYTWRSDGGVLRVTVEHRITWNR